MMSFSLKALFFGIVILSIILIIHSASAESWYIGKGLKQGDYFRYNVCHIDYHDCTPLEIDFWVQNQSSTSHDYFLQMLAIDGNNTQKGTVMTTDTLQPVYSDPNISNYSNVYKNTIIWLDDFTTKNSPANFSSSPWNPLGRHSSPPYLLSMKQEQVIVQDGSYNAWVIGWHEGVDNKIWVVPSIPFPVKAETWVDSMSGKPLPLFTFEMLETGNSQTEPVFTSQKLQCCGPEPLVIVKDMDSPLKQFRSGVQTKDIKCKQEFVLIMKTFDNSPACVTSNTAEKLLDRNWFLVETQKSDNLNIGIISTNTTSVQNYPTAPLLHISNQTLTHLPTIKKAMHNINIHWTYNQTINDNEARLTLGVLDSHVVQTSNPLFTEYVTNIEYYGKHYWIIIAVPLNY